MMDVSSIAGFSPIKKQGVEEHVRMEEWRQEQEAKERRQRGRVGWSPGDFTIGTKLGEGTFSKVYAAKEKESGFVCALKVVKKKHLLKEEKLKRQIKLEISIQRSLDHPNILQLYACFHDAHRLYMVLEYCPGGQLYDRIKHGISLDDTKSYVRQLVAALVYLHGLGIMHRDVKPENLLIDKRGRLRLGDFGWAIQGHSRRNTICGTIDYMSPEILTEGCSYSYPIDAWAVGIVTHELLTRTPPFAHPSPHQTYVNITTTAYRPPSSLPPLAASFIASLLTRDEALRMTMHTASKHPFLTTP